MQRIFKPVLYNIIFLPVILLIGFITSYEDITSSRIKNKWVFSGLFYSFLVYAFVWVSYGLGIFGDNLLWNFDKWCINLLISSITAYLLWHFKTWGAGDAKLFICYSALIPMGQYSRVYFDYYFASFLLLLAIFIPATAFLFLKSIAYFIKKFILSKDRKKTIVLIKEKLVKIDKKELSAVMLGFFVFFLSLQILRYTFYNLLNKILPNQNIVLLISLFLFQRLSGIFKKNANFLLIFSIALILYFGFKTAYSWEHFFLEIGSMLIRAMFIMAAAPVFKKIIGFYTERSSRKTTPFALWMFFGALISWFI